MNIIMRNLNKNLIGKCGIYIIQVLIEKLNVFYIRHLQKIVIKAWHFVKKILRRTK